MTAQRQGIYRRGAGNAEEAWDLFLYNQTLRSLLCALCVSSERSERARDGLKTYLTQSREERKEGQRQRRFVIPEAILIGNPDFKD